jgi:hypothetical protein
MKEAGENGRGLGADLASHWPAIVPLLAAACPHLACNWLELAATGSQLSAGGKAGPLDKPLFRL